MGLLEIVIIILILCWLLGVGTLGIMAGGGLIHLLLVIALVVIVIRLLQGRTVL